jgi:hypothetical protein
MENFREWRTLENALKRDNRVLETSLQADSKQGLFAPDVLRICTVPDDQC